MLGPHLLIDSADLATGAAVLILQSGNHGLAEEGLVHASEGFLQHFSKDIEAQIALLHSTRISRRGFAGEPLQQDRHRGHGGGSDA